MIELDSTSAAFHRFKAAHRGWYRVTGPTLKGTPVSEIHNHYYSVNLPKMNAYMATLDAIVEGAKLTTDRAWLLAKIEGHTAAIKELQEKLDALGGDDAGES